MYYVAVSNNTEANHTSCKEYVSYLCHHFNGAKLVKKKIVNFKILASFINYVRGFFFGGGVYVRIFPFILFFLYFFCTYLLIIDI